jgi:TolB protein
VGVFKGVNPDTGDYYDGDYPADKYVQSPSWSPDGAHLVYEGKQGISITAKGEDPRSLTPELHESVYATPAWSPQGDRIAYVRQMHNHWEIWSMNPDGADRQRLTPSGTKVGERAYNSVAPAWSPDGKYIAFLTDRDGEWRVCVMRADHAAPGKCGTGQRQLLDVPVRYEFNGDRVLDWAW